MSKRILTGVLIIAFAMTGCGNHAKIQSSEIESVDSEEAKLITTEENVLQEEISTEEVEKIVQSAEQATEQTEMSLFVETQEATKAEGSKLAEITTETVTAEAEAKAVEVTQDSEESSKAVEEKKITESQSATAQTQSQSSATQTDIGGTSNQTTSSTQLPTPSPHSCTWDGGNMTTLATCNSTGTRTFTCTGCGATRMESIPKTSHTYITETTPATCTEAGSVKCYCNICGDIQFENVGETAIGHVAGEKSYWPSAPTCRSGGHYNISCRVCGEHLESGSDSALPHTPVETITQQGDCIAATVISYDCGVCGIHLGQESYTEEHNWVSAEADYFNEETLEWEKVPIEYCTVCKRQKQ